MNKYQLYSNSGKGKKLKYVGVIPLSNDEVTTLRLAYKCAGWRYRVKKV